MLNETFLDESSTVTQNLSVFSDEGHSDSPKAVEVPWDFDIRSTGNIFLKFTQFLKISRLLREKSTQCTAPR
jgi:hypothetical protein